MMKILNSTEENKWFIPLNIELSEEQKAVLKNGTEEEKQIVIDYIKTNSFKNPTKKDSDAAKALYEANKPEGEFELIHVSVDLDDNSGFVNYRQDGEHRQYSF